MLIEFMAFLMFFVVVRVMLVTNLAYSTYLMIAWGWWCFGIRWDTWDSQFWSWTLWGVLWQGHVLILLWLEVIDSAVWMWWYCLSTHNMFNPDMLMIAGCSWILKRTSFALVPHVGFARTRGEDLKLAPTAAAQRPFFKPLSHDIFTTTPSLSSSKPTSTYRNLHRYNI